MNWHSRSPVSNFHELAKASGDVDLDRFVSDRPDLTPGDLVALIGIDQRASWQRGEWKRVADYLERFPAVRNDPDAVVDLIYSEILLSEELGRPYSWCDYFTSFPHLREELQRQAQFHTVMAMASDQTELSEERQRASACSTDDSGDTTTPARTGLPGFEIHAECGRGAIAVVYRATDQNLQRQVALKVLAEDYAVDSIEASRMRREAAAVAEIDHPAIVRVFAIHSDPRGRPLLVMEYVSGGNLADKFRGGPMPSQEAAELMRRVCEGVAAAHAAGLVHRDLKPANILLNDRGEPKVTDFGLVRREISPDGIDTATKTGTVVGTPAYMSPEQAKGGSSAVGPRSDVYSLGAILFEALCGRPPFQAAASWDLLHDVVHAEPPPVRHFNRRVPRELEAICAKCLAKNPRERYPDAGELGDDLGRYLKGERVTARPETLWKQSLRWWRANPRVAILSGTIAVLLLIVALGATWSAARLRQANRAAGVAKANAEQASRRAVRDRQAAIDALHHLIADLYDDLAKNPGTMAAREELVNTAMQGLHRIAELGDDRTVVLAHQRLGDLFSLQGKADQAEEQYMLACEMARRIAREHSERLTEQRDYATAEDKLAVFYLTHIGPEPARPHVIRERNVLERLDKRYPEDPALLGQLLTCHAHLLDIQWMSNEWKAVAASAAALRELIDRLRALEPNGDRFLQATVAIEQRLARAYLQAGDIEAAAQAVSQSTIAMEKRSRRSPGDIALERELALGRRFQAAVELAGHRPRQAAPYFHEALAILTRIAEQDPENVIRQQDVADTYSLMAQVPLSEGKFQRALEDMQRSTDAYRRALEMSPRSDRIRAVAAEAYIRQLRCQLALDDWPGMVETGRTARQVVLAGLAPNTGDPHAQSSTLRSLRLCCDALEHHAGRRTLADDSVAVSTLLAWYAYTDAHRGQIDRLSPTVARWARRVPGTDDAETIDDLLAVAQAVPSQTDLDRKALALTKLFVLAKRYQNAVEADGSASRICEDLRDRTLGQLEYLRQAHPEIYATATTEPELRWFRNTNAYRTWLHEKASSAQGEMRMQ